MCENIWLITLPHAGGSSNIFKGWDKNINCRILNVDYPGHWTRMKEPLVSTYEELKQDVINVIVGHVNQYDHVIIFGHSIGAILAWDITDELRNNHIYVDGLFLSASQNPGAFPEKSIVDSHTEEDVLKLVGYDPTQYTPSMNEQFKCFFLPIINNDLKICKSFIVKQSFCDVDAVVIYGTEDEHTHLNEINNWKNYVRCNTIKGLKGNHFYLETEENKKELFKLIKNMTQNRE